MAQIIEEKIQITVSHILKDGISADDLVTADLTSTLESVAQELLGAGAVVEVAVI
jgi:hypothetical protein